MIENRKYNFVGELLLNRSRVLNEWHQPKDDKTNWLFLNGRERQFSFAYEIENPLEARYEKPFKAKLAFTMSEVIDDFIKLNTRYEVLRGQEVIGTMILLNGI